MLTLQFALPNFLHNKLSIQTTKSFARFCGNEQPLELVGLNKGPGIDMAVEAKTPYLSTAFQAMRFTPLTFVKAMLALVVFLAGWASVMAPAAAQSTTTFIISGLSRPFGIAFDSTGNLYIVNQNAGIVSEYSPSGNMQAVTYLHGIGTSPQVTWTPGVLSKATP